MPETRRWTLKERNPPNVAEKQKHERVKTGGNGSRKKADGTQKTPLRERGVLPHGSALLHPGGCGCQSITSAADGRGHGLHDSGLRRPLTGGCGRPEGVAGGGPDAARLAPVHPGAAAVSVAGSALRPQLCFCCASVLRRRPEMRALSTCCRCALEMDGMCLGRQCRQRCAFQIASMSECFPSWF